LRQALTKEADRDWQDNWVWGNGLDALVSGAGQPEIRAGVLHLYASIKGLVVRRTTFAGRNVLSISADVFDSDYTGTLLIDAATGIPRRLTAGLTGQVPKMRIEGTVTRTSVAAVRSGTAAALRQQGRLK
jgi:hypothetical protein